MSTTVPSWIDDVLLLSEEEARLLAEAGVHVYYDFKTWETLLESAMWQMFDPSAWEEGEVDECGAILFLLKEGQEDGKES